MQASDLPETLPWAQRVKGVRSMPGGYLNYGFSLKRVCTAIDKDHLSPEDLVRWLHSDLRVAQSGSKLCVAFLRSARLIDVANGICVVNPWVQRWQESTDSRYLAAMLHSHCRFIGEMLVACREPRSIGELLSYVNEHFDAGWSSPTQIATRRGWLQSLDMLALYGDGLMYVTPSGAEFMAEISIEPPLDGDQRILSLR